MGESFKYIEVLCDVGASLASLNKEYPNRIEDAPPIYELSEDWQDSYSRIKTYYDSLASLDYNSVYMEGQQPNAKMILEGWHSSLVSCISLSFLLDNYGLYYQGMKEVLNTDFRRSVNDYTIKGIWTYKQGQDFISLCSEILRLWEKRRKELCTVYGITKIGINNLLQSSIEQPDEIVKMFQYKTYCDEFFDISNMAKRNISQWGKRAKRFKKGGKLNLNDGDLKKLFYYIIVLYPELKTKAKDEGYSAFRHGFYD